jgi:hypothetical protein
MISDSAVVALVTGCVTLVNRWHGKGEFRVDNVQPLLAAIAPSLAIVAVAIGDNHTSEHLDHCCTATLAI